MRFRPGSGLPAVFLATLLGGCTPLPDVAESVAVEGPAPAASPQTPPVSAPPQPNATVPRDALAWRWITHDGEEQLPQVRQVAVGHNFATKHASYQLVVDTASGEAKVQKTSKGEVWSTTLQHGALSGGYLILEYGHLFAASYSPIASGAKVFALDPEDGHILWQTDVRGLGNVNHSQYRNRVQLRAAWGTVTAYGNESNGRYVEAFDVTTGRMLHNGRVDDGVAEIPWAFSDDVERRDKATAQADGVTFEVSYTPSASGAVLSASGPDVDWEETLLGLGPVSHWGYSNAVEIRVEPGRVVVSGKESAGRYIEVRHPEDGRLLSNLRFLGVR